MTPEELDKLVADELAYGQHGIYVNSLFRAWQCADPGNRLMLRPVIEQTITKYQMPTKVAEMGELREKVRSSDVFIIAATQNYVNDLATGDEFVTAQYAFMREFKERPVVIVWSDITEDAKPYIRHRFDVFRTVHELTPEQFTGEEGQKLLKELSATAGRV